MLRRTAYLCVASNFVSSHGIIEGITMKSVLAGIVTAALLVSSVSAETVPLPAGKAAGTKEASLFGLAGLPLYLTIAALGLTVAAAAGGFSGHNTVVNATTTGSGG
jgi:hypothetical protein